ncbi:MAG: hypothetical protein JRN35_05545 [Nitrososphaerota archaeon]|nr:hypothetical protein [Nitrososphaerota archaeon]
MNPHHEGLFDQLMRDRWYTNTLFFCGSGLSLHAGIPLGGKLKARIIDAASDGDAILRDALERVPFEGIMEGMWHFRCREKTISRLFMSRHPTPGHTLLAYYLAYRMTNGTSGIGASAIATTNFDRLFERAFLKLFSVRKHLPGVRLYSNLSIWDPVDRTIDTLTPERVYCQGARGRRGTIHHDKFDDYFLSKSSHGVPQSPLLIKLHSSLELGNLGGGAYPQSLRRLGKHGLVYPLRFVFADGPHTTVVVLGYSMSDDYDINPILRHLPAEDVSNKRIVYVHHKRGISAANALRESKLPEPLRRFKGYTLTVDTDKLIGELAMSIGLETPLVDFHPSDYLLSTIVSPLKRDRALRHDFCSYVLQYAKDSS